MFGKSKESTPAPAGQASVQAVTVAKKLVRIAWNTETMRAFPIRMAKIGAKPSSLLANFSNPSKAEYAFTAFLWALLPADVYREYPIPEDLHAHIDPEDTAANYEAVSAVIDDINATAEKKSISKA